MSFVKFKTLCTVKCRWQTVAAVLLDEFQVICGVQSAGNKIPCRLIQAMKRCFFAVRNAWRDYESLLRYTVGCGPESGSQIWTCVLRLEWVRFWGEYFDSCNANLSEAFSTNSCKNTLVSSVVFLPVHMWELRNAKTLNAWTKIVSYRSYIHVYSKRVSIIFRD